MASVPLHYVDLRAFSYATEDDARVEQALRTFLPEEFDLERTDTAGHHGDHIVVYSARVETADELRTVVDRVRSLPDDEFDELCAQLPDRVDEDCSLYVTFDKQAAFGGEVELGDGVTMRAKIEAYPANRSAAVENARELFEAARS